MLVVALLALGTAGCVGWNTHDTPQQDCACARVRGGAAGACPSCSAQSARDSCGHCDCPDGQHYGCC
jgi:hypothetical protein